ncbi:TorF family putative porin [Shewanella sp. 1_MG-2023]|uniref:TorF family putative porin n=1 Tax=Shewanella electrodiphila TaxID=934143 RepID=A0ABT0KS86_9GAMM|nr:MULTISPECIES: TorF family putative porin [Shewanella]MCC4834206.1 TorF family putative porin [Shewanella sp. 10N.7]MCL1046720.1 TorF family putative porin [Shewanella electrodiphila]MDO6611208.1 TorF family putative porin [Shewanella sp. 7_MG-2023]MDO6770915.1 TorF family putative porin [Shewanella sp. 2_MG-2023]MDO6794698.1 TorF family putative porin [Shewanella sp. 1_MG-2023]
MKTSIYKAIALSTGLLLSGSALAEVTGNIGATSNYLWRGVSQTDNGAAVQGGIDYAADSGFYVGGWASNVDFGDGTSYELDIYAGYGGNITEDLSYDINYLYYAYPDSPGSVDFGEVTVGLAWKWLDVSYSHTVNGGDDIAAEPLDSADMMYAQANLTFPLTEKLSLGVHYGYSDGDVIMSWFDTDSYSEYNVSLSADTDYGTVSFTASDTDLDEDDAKIVLGYSYSFGL